MNKETLEKLIEEKLSTHEIAKETNQSQTNVRYWLRKFGLNTYNSPLNTKRCVICNEQLNGLKTRFCSRVCKNKGLSNNPNNYFYQESRAKQRKLALIELSGGSCQICGYKKNWAALTFHHLNPTNKLFCIDLRKCGNTNWKSLVMEAEKCQLLCQNCHAEVHHPHCEMVGGGGNDPQGPIKGARL